MLNLTTLPCFTRRLPLPRARRAAFTQEFPEHVFKVLGPGMYGPSKDARRPADEKVAKIVFRLKIGFEDIAKWLEFDLER